MAARTCEDPLNREGEIQKVGRGLSPQITQISQIEVIALRLKSPGESTANLQKLLQQREMHMIV